MNRVYEQLKEISLCHPEFQFEEGKSEHEIFCFLNDLSLPPDKDLIEYFTYTNGGILGPGTLLGIGRDDDFLNIGFYREIEDYFLSNPILPIATDGSGNVYGIVLDANDTKYGSVYFIDMHSTKVCLDYVVSSSLERFIYFVLRYYSSPTRFGWPYDRQYMLVNDPLLFDPIKKHIFIWDI